METLVLAAVILLPFLGWLMDQIGKKVDDTTSRIPTLAKLVALKNRYAPLAITIMVTLLVVVACVASDSGWK